MDTDHDRLHVAMGEKAPSVPDSTVGSLESDAIGRISAAVCEPSVGIAALDRADIVAPSSGCVADNWPLRVKRRLKLAASARSAFWGESDVFRQ